MNTLRIYNYEILNFDTEPMVFSATGFTKITEPNITNALKRIEKIRSKYIHYDALQQLLRDENLHPDTAIQFLKSLLIISEKAETPHIKNTIIYHDLNISDNLKLHLEKTNERNIQFKDLPTNDLPHSDSPTLYVLACLKLWPRNQWLFLFSLPTNKRADPLLLQVPFTQTIPPHEQCQQLQS